jgi:hypothetical protein
MTKKLFLALLAPFLIFTGVVFAKVNQNKPRYNRQEVPPEKACVEGKAGFNHKRHIDEMGLKCGDCHELVTKKNAVQGETQGDIRRPDHGACISCHGENKSGSTYFFEADDAKRTICANCHTPRKEASGKPLEGTENDPIAAPDTLDYANPKEKPCTPTFGYDFSHAAHAAQPCSDCHAVLTDKDPKAGMMVKGPSHPSCFRCHDTGNNQKAATQAKPDTCLACHPYQGKQSAKLSYLSGGREEFFFQFSHQSHIKSFEGAFPEKKSNAICESCHTSMDDSFSLMEEKNLHPNKDKQLTSACFCCHYEGNSTTFAASSSCTSCHTKLSGIPVAPASHTKSNCGF